MNARSLSGSFFPKKFIYHLKILIGSLFVTMFFSTIWSGRPINENFWFMFISVVFQLEIFMIIALKVFSPDKIKRDGSYKKKIIFKLIKFYLIVFSIAVVILLGIISIGMLKGDASFSELLQLFVRNELKGMLLSWLIGIGIGSLVFFYMEWNNALKREQKLREEKLISQYETLKQQVNPHFLFNSLNTLSSLVAKDASLSEKFISKFSSIYRYVLDKQIQDLVPLEEELDFVKDYFFLQKIRDDGKIELEIDIDGSEEYIVLPISIQLLVENALKHNAATRERPLRIRISNTKDELFVENNLMPKMQLDDSSKIGLKNLGERVKLIMNKEINVASDSDTFRVTIPLKPV
jgi:hypothetical protein